MAEATDTPDYLRPEVVAAEPDLALIHDLLGGTRRMRCEAQGRQYIVQWPDEKPETYAKRVKAATVYEGLGRTRSAAVGKLFAKPPTVDFGGAEAALKPRWENVDAQGTKGHVFAKRFMNDAIADGYALILTDYTPRPEGAVVTSANEGALGLRAKWAMYARSSVCSWRSDVVNGELVTTQLVLAESSTEPAGAYAVRHVERYRVLRVTEGVANWSLYRKEEDAHGQVTFHLEGSGLFKNRAGQTRGTLPIAVAYTGEVSAPFVARPPLLGLAWANLSHWQNKTELQWGSKIAAIEQFVIKGRLMDPTGNQSTGGAVKIGWEHAVNVEAEGDALWIGPTGNGLGQLKARMEEDEQEMAALGMSFLSRDTRAAETAEAKKLDASSEDSTLSTSAQGGDDALNLALQDLAWFEGIEAASAPTIEMNRDYSGTVLSPAAVTALAALIKEGMPIRTAVACLVTGGIIVANEEEQEVIIDEWLLGQETKQRQEEQEAADRAAQMQGGQPPQREAA